MCCIGNNLPPCCDCQFANSYQALFIGFSFWDSALSLQGLQNQLFAIFMIMTIFGNMVQQIMPHFVTQRSLYEVRERPSKTYSWIVFMLSNIVVELPWNTLMAVLIFACWYYPIGMYRNAIPTGAENERGGLMFLFVWQFMLFTSTFTDMVVAGMDSSETAGNVAQLLFSLTLIFCGSVVFLHLSRSQTNYAQCPRWSCHPSRLLDFHVSRFPFHVSR